MVLSLNCFTVLYWRNSFKYPQLFQVYGGIAEKVFMSLLRSAPLLAGIGYYSVIPLFQSESQLTHSPIDCYLCSSLKRVSAGN
jgi:hypothetical protein